MANFQRTESLQYTCHHTVDTLMAQKVSSEPAGAPPWSPDLLAWGGTYAAWGAD